MDHDGEQQATREPLATYEALAQMIDHSLVRPELTEDQVRTGCLLAAEYGVATVTVRPSDIDQAVRYLRGSATRPASVAGFPHGDSGTATKLYEARDLIRRGAAEIDMVINIGKLISRQFPYVETELVQMAGACRSEGVVLKVILENAYLTTDLKIIACKIAKRAEVDFVKTSTGFAPSGCTLEDVRLMYGKCAPRVKVKAAAGVRSLESALAFYEAGADRFGCTATAAILDEWKAHLAQKENAGRTPAPAPPTP